MSLDTVRVADPIARQSARSTMSVLPPTRARQLGRHQIVLDLVPKLGLGIPLSRQLYCPLDETEFRRQGRYPNRVWERGPRNGQRRLGAAATALEEGRTTSLREVDRLAGAVDLHDQLGITPFAGGFGRNCVNGPLPFRARNRNGQVGRTGAAAYLSVSGQVPTFAD